MPLQQRERAWPPVIRPPRCLRSSSLVSASNPRERRRGSSPREGSPRGGLKPSASARNAAVETRSALCAASLLRTPPRTQKGSIARSRVATARVAAVGGAAHSSELQVEEISAVRVVHATAVGDEAIGHHQTWPPADVRRKRRIASMKTSREEEIRWLGSLSRMPLRPHPSDSWSGRWDVHLNRLQHFRSLAGVSP